MARRKHRPPGLESSGMASSSHPTTVGSVRDLAHSGDRAVARIAPESERGVKKSSIKGDSVVMQSGSPSGPVDSCPQCGVRYRRSIAHRPLHLSQPWGKFQYIFSSKVAHGPALREFQVAPTKAGDTTAQQQSHFVLMPKCGLSVKRCQVHPLCFVQERFNLLG